MMIVDVRVYPKGKSDVLASFTCPLRRIQGKLSQKGLNYIPEKGQAITEHKIEESGVNSAIKSEFGMFELRVVKSKDNPDLEVFKSVYRKFQHARFHIITKGTVKVFLSSLTSTSFGFNPNVPGWLITDIAPVMESLEMSLTYSKEGEF